MVGGVIGDRLSWLWLMVVGGPGAGRYDGRRSSPCHLKLVVTY